jgi:hypothetical protein
MTKNNDSNVAPATSQPNLLRLIHINLAVAIFVLLSNGSALMFALSGKAPEVMANLLEVILILTSATIVLSTALFAKFNPNFRENALSIHAVFLATGAFMLLAWGLSLALHTTNDLANTGAMKVTWSVGWLTALSSYSAYLITNTFLSKARDSSFIVKHAYVWVGVLILFIDVFIFVRPASSILIPQ